MVPSHWHDEPEVVDFLREVRRAIPGPRWVVEVGSYAMHDHDARAWWASEPSGYSRPRWTGVDARPGPGVDLVGLAHEVMPALNGGPHCWPVLVLSVSALEHDPHWRETLAAMAGLASRYGGVAAVSCAGPGWGEHERDCAPGGDWYENRSTEDLASALDVLGCERVTTWTTQRSCHPHWPRVNALARWAQPRGGAR